MRFFFFHFSFLWFSLNPFIPLLLPCFRLGKSKTWLGSGEDTTKLTTHTEKITSQEWEPHLTNVTGALKAAFCLNEAALSLTQSSNNCIESENGLAMHTKNNNNRQIAQQRDREIIWIFNSGTKCAHHIIKQIYISTVLNMNTVTWYWWKCFVPQETEQISFGLLFCDAASDRCIFTFLHCLLFFTAQQVWKCWQENSPKRPFHPLFFL